MPYVALISVIVGVTNVIPFFGPYIGAIPSTILIMLDSPSKGVIFLLFIIILQQVDGNIIGPKILGESTGLSPFWVVFAIFLGNGLFWSSGAVHRSTDMGCRVLPDKEICELSCEEERINVLLKNKL